MIFYKNGDTYYPGIEFRFKPGRDIINMESLLDKLSLRMDLPRGARYGANVGQRVRFYGPKTRKTKSGLIVLKPLTRHSFSVSKRRLIA